jgi:hypothetical protein
MNERHPDLRSRATVAAVVGTMLVAVSGAGLALGATTDVTTTTDGGAGSLRQAIIDANANPGPDTINLPAGTYTLSIAGTGEDAAATGDLDITDDLTISGAGAATTIIDADGLDNVLQVIGGSTTVTIGGLTIRNGDSGGTDGGGIQNEGSLALDGVIVEDNSSDGKGGGISSEGSSELTITDSIIRGNTAGDDGGGVQIGSSATATITRTLFEDNETVEDGGAIEVQGHLDLVDSTLAGNHGENGGGGIDFNDDSTGTVHGSTITGNLGDTEAGGIDIDDSVDVEIVNSTIAGNTSGRDGSGVNVWINSTLRIESSTVAGNTGGSAGIFNDGADSVSLVNSIVAGNAGADCSGDITSLGGNVSSDASCSLVAASDQASTDPLLGALAANGGSTQTMALLAGSPAIDAGVSCPPPATDQRGQVRPGGAGCDAGAFEVQGGSAPTVPPAPSATLPPTDRSVAAGGSNPSSALALAAAVIAAAAAMGTLAVRRKRER